MITKVSIFENARSVEPVAKELSWDELSLLLSMHDFGHADKLSVPAFCPAEFAPGATRAKRNVLCVHFGVLDLDKVEPERIDELLSEMRSAGLAFVFYTTWSHPEAVGRGLCCARLVFPFDRAVEAWEWDAFWSRMHDTLRALGDTQCRDPSRIYFFPSAPAGTEEMSVVDVHRGSPFPVGELSAAPPTTTAAQRAPRNVGVRDLQELYRSLKGARTPAKVWMREKVAALVAGESLAPPGERDDTVWRIVCEILDVIPNADAQQLAALFAPSLQVMELEARDAPTVGNIADKIRRKQQEKAEVSIATEVVRDEERKRSIRMAFEFEDGRDWPYTIEELEYFAREFGVSIRDLRPFWIIQKDNAYYVYVAGRYRGPFTGIELEKAAQQYLAPAHSAGIELYTNNNRGEPVPKDAKRLVRDYGTLADAVHIDLCAQMTHYDRMRRVVVEAPCPLRVREAVYSHEVARWLALLGGPHAEKLVDWLSVVTKLDEPCAALYFEGVKGAGKSLFADAVSRLWSDRGPIPLGDAMSAFNSTIVECPIIFADEAVPRDFRGQTRTGELRQFIQARTRMLRRKYIADATFKGCVRLILAANNADLISSNEHLTVNDIEAIVDRIVHVEAPREAADYLRSLPKETVRGFVTNDVVAKHALWLRENHKPDTSHRFLVTGDRSRLHRRLTTSSGLRSAICNWLVAYLMEPRKVDATKTLLVRIDDGRLLVNVRACSKFWDIYETNVDPPTTGALSSALGGLADRTKEKVQLTDGSGARTHYWNIDKDNLVSWAEDNGFCTREAVLEALSRPTTG